MDNLHLWAVNNAYRYRFFFQVVLPQTGGSNKAGYRLVYSNTKGDFNLDGVFNVISYDVVPKIKDMLLDLDFKVGFCLTCYRTVIILQAWAMGLGEFAVEHIGCVPRFTGCSFTA